MKLLRFILACCVLCVITLAQNPVVRTSWTTNLTANVVLDLTALRAFDGSANYVSVSDTNRGGLFVYTTTAHVTNAGTIFEAVGKGSGRWVREFSGDVNVRWFGATGDASVDQRTELIAALTYMTNYAGTLYFPAGWYRTDDTITLTLNTNIITLKGDGQDSVLYGNIDGSAPTYKQIILLARLGGAAAPRCGGFNVDGLHFRGNADTNAITPGAAIANTTTHPLPDNIRISNCRFSDMHVCLDINPSSSSVAGTNAIVTGCHFQNIARHSTSWSSASAVFWSRFEGLTIEKCTFARIGNDGTGWNLYLGSSSGGYRGSDLTVRDVFSSDGAGTGVDFATNVRFDNVTLTNEAFSGFWFQGCTNLVADNLVCWDVGEKVQTVLRVCGGDGVRVSNSSFLGGYKPSTTAGVVYFYNNAYGYLTNAVLDHCRIQTSANGVYGMYAHYARNWEISDCIITAPYPLRVQYSVDGLRLLRNRVYITIDDSTRAFPLFYTTVTSGGNVLQQGNYIYYGYDGGGGFNVYPSRADGSYQPTNWYSINDVFDLARIPPTQVRWNGASGTTYGPVSYINRTHISSTGTVTGESDGSGFNMSVPSLTVRTNLSATGGIVHTISAAPTVGANQAGVYAADDASGANATLHMIDETGTVNELRSVRSIQDLTDATATAVVSLTLSTNTVVGGTINYTIWGCNTAVGTDTGTNLFASGVLTYSAAGTLNTTTNLILASLDDVQGTDASNPTASATVTWTWTAVEDAVDTLTLYLNADHDLAATVSDFKVLYQVNDNSSHLVTPK